MKIKNINLSLAILVSLLVLSFSFFVSAQQNSSSQNNIFLDSDQDGLTNQEEKLYGTDPYNPDTDGDGYSDGAEVKAGYDPLKAGPNDKIGAENTAASTNNSAPADQSTATNLTQQVAQKVADITANASSTDTSSAAGGDTTSSDTTGNTSSTDTSQTDSGVTLDQLQSITDSTLSSSTDSIDLPVINKDDIKIKKQNYSGLSADEAKKKKKEDFSNYISAVFYILASNSPQPLTSSDDITSLGSQISDEINTAITNRDPSSLSDLNKSGDKILDQLKQVEVPEDVVDIHIKALQFAYAAKNVEQYISPNADDPLKDIANFSKIQGLLGSLISFSDEVQQKFTEYGLTYSDVQDKLKSYGIDPITDAVLLQELSQ